MHSSDAKTNFRVFLYTGLFCLGIGITNWAIDSGVSLGASLAVSFCIGWSINLSFFTLDKLCHRFLSPYAAPVPLTAIGLVVGLIIAGTLVIGEPLFFFTENYFTLVTGVFFGIVGFLLFNTRGRLLQAEADLATANADRARQEKLVTETELKLLQAQIEPHFLFNTLSNIASLIHEHPASAEKTLLNLTTLLRATLDRTRRQTTTLAQEMEIAEAYLEIQATRMQGRLTYEIDQEPDLTLMQLPPLIVQPLIENAVKHGIEPCEQGGKISIEIKRLDGHVEILVADTGCGFTSGAMANGGHSESTGLPNVRERLKALYTDATLTLTEPASGGVHARLQLPYPIRETSETET